MKFYRFTAAATFVTTLVGAGFASGREISLYFARTSIMTPILAGAFLGLFCYLFLTLGAMTNGDILPLFGKLKRPVDIVMFLCNIITFCAMLAGSESVIYSLFHIHGGCVITGVLGLIAIKLGIEKIKLISFLALPFIVALIIYLYVKKPATDEVPFARLAILPAFTYSTMNIISGGYLVSTFSAKYTKRDCVITALIAGLILTALLTAAYLVIQTKLDDAMPLMSASKEANALVFGNVVMYLAIFTTVTSCLSISCKNKFAPAVIITCAAFIAASIGFAKIVNTFYPIMGAAGAVISVYCVIVFFRLKSSTKTKLTTDKRQLTNCG